MADVPSNYLGTGDLWGYTYDEVMEVRAKWTPFGESSHEYMWQDDAACEGVDPAESFMDEAGDEQYDGMSTRTIRPKLVAVNLPRYEKFKSTYCDNCPVLERCASEAQSSDKYWSVRGGEMPTLLQLQMEKGSKIYAPAFDRSDYFEWSCPQHGREFLGWKDRKKADGTPYKAEICVRCNTLSKNPDRPR